jgi:hypothetical protein
VKPMTPDGEAVCLACDAARRDAAELFVTVVTEAEGIASPRAQRLVEGMDAERSWRVALFMAGIAAGLTDGFADATGVSAVEVAEVFAEELAG